MTATGEPLAIEVGERVGRVSGLLLRPPEPWAGYILAHGAGAGMTHPFMESMARVLMARGIATLRYQFPYAEAGNRRPDPPRVLIATVRAAMARARELLPALRLFAGGKSLGGRMTSHAAAERPLEDVAGLIFLGFPLHPPKRPAIERAEHLARVKVPMLFLQGTRDDLADLGLVRSVCAGLGDRATLHIVEGADHSFAVLKRSGRTGSEVLEELGDTIAGWCRTV
ncbi:MAG TPA: alpha/beta family hydrolase [Gemmatimonadales bacterium]|nr:alpha/beta family hydrolase [Gemmatimonadales bacterium]